MVIKKMKRKLQIELVPSTSWHNNMRKMMSTENWDKLRREVYRQYEHVCGICHAEGMIHCHEIWSYDDKKHIQKLDGFIALCEMCHHVKHLGFASIKAMSGELDYQKVIEHYMKVNNCSQKEFDKDKKEAFTLWRKRSKYKWKLKLGKYAELVDADAPKVKP